MSEIIITPSPVDALGNKPNKVLVFSLNSVVPMARRNEHIKKFLRWSNTDLERPLSKKLWKRTSVFVFIIKCTYRFSRSMGKC